MSKSVLAIAAIGCGGCVLLALLMKQLAQHRVAQHEPPAATELAARFADRVVGPVTVHEEHEGRWVRLAVHARAVPGGDRVELGVALGTAVWQRLRTGERCDEVAVTLHGDHGAASTTVLVPRPQATR